MHLRAKPPIFLPTQYWKEVEKLSKATLMDLVWDYAQIVHGDEKDVEGTMEELRKSAEIIVWHRKNTI